MLDKKLTLNAAWKNCLRMWKWIAEQVEKGTGLDAIDLKHKWIEKHPQFEGLRGNCFFCEHDSYEDEACQFCPGKLVNKRFHCERAAYDYYKRPLKFYQKLVELDGKRKKGGKR